MNHKYRNHNTKRSAQMQHVFMNLKYKYTAVSAICRECLCTTCAGTTAPKSQHSSHRILMNHKYMNHIAIRSVQVPQHPFEPLRQKPQQTAVSADYKERLCTTSKGTATPKRSVQGAQHPYEPQVEEPQHKKVRTGSTASL